MHSEAVIFEDIAMINGHRHTVSYVVSFIDNEGYAVRTDVRVSSEREALDIQKKWNEEH